MASTRDKLRESAVALFSERGFKGTTIGDIEARAGLTPRAGSFYRHYASKKEVLDDCIESLSRDVFEDSSFSTILPLGDVRAELLVIGRTILALAERHARLRVLLRNLAQQKPEFRKRLQDLNRRFFDETLVDWVERTVGDGESRSTAALIFGPVLYHMLQKDVGSPPFDLADEELINRWADHWAMVLEARATINISE